MIRKSRKSALEHYRRNAGGEYVYTGGYMVYEDRGKSRKRALGELWCITALGAAGNIGCGFISAPGTQNTAYVLLPLMCTVITAVACLWTLGQITSEGDPMKEYVYQDSVLKLPRRLIAGAVFSGLTAAGELLHLILSGLWGLPGLAVVALDVAALVLYFFGKSRFSALKWQKKP